MCLLEIWHILNILVCDNPEIVYKKKKKKKKLQNGYEPFFGYNFVISIRKYPSLFKQQFFFHHKILKKV